MQKYHKAITLTPLKSADNNYYIPDLYNIEQASEDTNCFARTLVL